MTSQEFTLLCKGRKLKDVAQELEITPSAVSMFRNGTRKIPHHIAGKAHLLYGDPGKEENTPSAPKEESTPDERFQEVEEGYQRKIMSLEAQLKKKENERTNGSEYCISLEEAYLALWEWTEKQSDFLNGWKPDAHHPGPRPKKFVFPGEDITTNEGDQTGDINDQS